MVYSKVNIMSYTPQTRPRLAHLIAGFVIIALLGIAGCGAAGGHSSPSSPSPAISLIPASIDFGNVPPGQSGTQSVKLTNSSSSALTISSSSLTGSEFSMSGLTTPLSLAAGQSAYFTVDFTPTAAGGKTGNVALVSSSSGSPINISLKGTCHWVTLSWTASTSTSVVGYYIYRATQTGGVYSPLNSTPIAATSYNDTSVSPGSQYYYVITAVNSDGVQSINSNQASAAVPTP